MSDQVRYHPPQLIEQLLDWCAEHAADRADAVSAIGLAYVHGLNAHQLARAIVVNAAEHAVICYPLARRAAEIRDAARSELEIEGPAWLVEATLALARGSAPGELLYRPRNRFAIPLKAPAVAKIAAAAAAEATGKRISIASLNTSRSAAVCDAGMPLALHGIGYAPTWSARLTCARRILILPRAA